MKISVLQYAKTLLELTENKTEKEISPVVARFAEVLKKDGQMKNAAKIMEKFSEIYNVKHQIVEAEIISHGELRSELRSKLHDFLQKKYGAKEVVMNSVVDEKIKGGIIIKVGDEVLDASVSAQLKRLSSALSN